MTEISLRIMIDADGQWAPLNDDDDDAETFETHTGDAPTHPTRIITLALTVPTPEAIKLAAIVPPEAMPNTPVTLTIQ